MIDDLDRELIRQLQADGRLSFAALGQRVGLSDAATRQRVRRLTTAGIIDIVAITDPTKLGLDFQAVLQIKVSGDVVALASSIAELHEAHYVVITAGSYDIMAELVCADQKRFLALVTEIRQFDGVDSVEVVTYLDVVKQTYDWGVNR